MPFAISLDDIRWIEKGINDNFQAIGRAMAKTQHGRFCFAGVARYRTAKGSLRRGHWRRAQFGRVTKFGWLYAHTINKLAASGSYYMKQVITNDATGSETFESGATVDTYQKRRVWN